MGISNSIDRFNGLVASLAVKTPCVVATNANITLSGTQTINGIAVVTGDRVLVKDQTSAVDNGIYNVTSTAWNRAADFDGNRDVTENSLIVVGVNGLSPVMYRVSTTLPITIGSTAINFEIFFASEGLVVIEGDTIAGDDNSTTVLIFTDSDGEDQVIDPSVSQIIAITDDYTFVLGDKGDTVSRTGSTAGVVVTIPAESSVDYRLGTFLGFNNDGTDAITIAITTDTLTWADDNTTGSLEIAPGGYAVAQKVADGKWKIAGKQITRP